MPYRNVLLLVLFLTAVPVHATVIVPAELREVVNGSDLIAYGRVAATTVEWSDDRKRIDTIVSLQVGTYLKGNAGSTLVFKVPGGQIGRFRNVMVGAPQFAVGEEAVIFLTARGDGHPFVFGLNQGVFRVRLDGQSRRIVIPPALLAVRSEPETVVRGTARPLALETFGAHVQTILAETARSVR